MAQSDETTTCARHPKTVTSLRCASCGTLICPKCLVQTPVGAKCRQCGLARGGVLFRPSPLQVGLAAVTGLLTGAVAGLGVEWLGFYSIFLAMAYGPFAAELIMRASGRKRGVRMEIIAGVTMILGALLGRLAMAALILPTMAGARPPHGVFDVLLRLVYPLPIPAIALVVAVAAAVSRIRYL